MGASAPPPPPHPPSPLALRLCEVCRYIKKFIFGSSIENFITLSRSGIGTNCEVKRNRNLVNKEEIFITIFYLISKSTMLNKY